MTGPYVAKLSCPEVRSFEDLQVNDENTRAPSNFTISQFSDVSGVRSTTKNHSHDYVK